jgi:hypothetical protein
VGATISVTVTAKEKLLREVLDLDEVEAASARIVIEHGPGGRDADLEALLDEEADEQLGELDARESRAGLGSSKK